MEKKYKTGTDFSGIGAFDEAMKRLGLKQDKKFACDSDKYARDTYIKNHGEPEYYPEDVYEREIPEDPLDIYVTTPPCQSFSMAGNRGGENDDRGVLFYNSHEFIKKNGPRFFIFENVKGLLSDDGGRTFGKWKEYLGGKSVNGTPTIFPHPESVEYHIYFFVLNAKHYGIPQNRERIFIIRIRDDEDNYFRIPKPFPLEKRILDILEQDVPQKYFLSKKMLKGFISGTEKQKEKDNGFGFEIADVEGVAKAITTKPGGRKTDNFINVGHINQDTQASQVFSPEGISPTITAGSKGYANGYIKVKSANQKGFEVAEVGDSISLSQPNSETRRGRVGKQIANTIETSPNMAVFVGTGAIRGRGEGWQQTLEMNKESISNTVTSVQKDNVLVYEDMIRKFTPREVLRLMDFSDSFSWDVSDTQIYKQGGNSIPVGLLVAILKSLLRIKYFIVFIIQYKIFYYICVTNDN